MKTNVVALLCLLVLLCAPIVHGAGSANLLGEDPFAKGARTWNVSGRKTSFDYHEDSREIEVTDLGDQVGELTSSYVKIQPDESYRVNAQMRVSGDGGNSALLEVIWADSGKRYVGSRPSLIKTSDTQWQAVRKDVTPDPRASYMRIRLMPATEEAKATGSARLKNVAITRTKSKTASVAPEDAPTASVPVSESPDHAEAQWSLAGKNVTGKLDEVVRHSTGQAWYVVDRGPQMGQSNSPRMPVKEDASYFVKLWVKLDPELPDKVVVDIQCLRADNSARGGSIGAATLGKQQRGWVRVAKIFTPRQGATQASIRVMPAASSGASHGACWIDDVVFKRIEDITAEDMDLNQAKNAEVEDRPTRVNFTDTAAPVAGGFDFEDLAGWSLRHQEGMDSVRLSRSQRQLCQGDYVARLTYQTVHAGQTVELVPPKPIVVDKPFDTITMWIGQFFDNFTLANVMWNEGPTPRVNLIDAEGNSHRVMLSRVVWQNWSVARGKLPNALPAPVKIEAIALDNLPACVMLTGPRSYPGTAPRNYAFDALRLTNEGTADVGLRLPEIAIPTRPDTLLPSLSVQDFKTGVKQEGKQRYTFEYRGADETVQYAYEPTTGLLDDLRVSVEGGAWFQPMAGGGAVFDAVADGKSIERRLLGCNLANGVVTARWQCDFGNTTTILTYRMELKQKTLFLSVRANNEQVSAFLWGGIGEAAAESFYVPFLIWSGWQQQHSVHLVENSVFVSRMPDFYVSDFSDISFDGAQGVNKYNRLTDGTRHKLNERWLITASRSFDDVLPNIPHPPNKAAKAFASYVFARDHLLYNRTRRDRAAGLQYVRLCKRYGVDRLMIKMTHLSSDQSDWGLLPAMNVYDQAPRSMEGGVEAFSDYVRAVQEMGFKTLLYTDYHELDPTSEFWNPDFAIQKSDGNWMDGWRHCYKMTPLAAPQVARRMTRRIKDVFNIDGTYLDESGSGPWLTDYDARKPGAGLARVAHKAQMEMAAAESPIHGGPSYGEGGMQWFWAGLLSGTYGQSYWPAWNDKNVWLVDFEVRKVHPLMTNLSMGYSLSRYAGLPTNDRSWAIDRFNAAAIAFGHAGCFKVPIDLNEGDHIDGPRWIWREKGELFRQYFTFQALQEAYALVGVASVHYEKGGKEYTTSDAIRQDVVNTNHVHVAYENGLHVYVNGSLNKDDVWQVQRGEKTHRLPQNGYLFEQPGKLLGYGALIDGHRVDLVDGPRYLWADARGRAADFGPLQTAGCVVIRKEISGGKDVVMVSGDTVTLDLPALALADPAAHGITAMDEQENPLDGGKVTRQNNRVTLESTPQIISYRFTDEGRPVQ